MAYFPNQSSPSIYRPSSCVTLPDKRYRTVTQRISRVKAWDKRIIGQHMLAVVMVLWKEEGSQASTAVNCRGSGLGA